MMNRWIWDYRWNIQKLKKEEEKTLSAAHKKKSCPSFGAHTCGKLKWVESWAQKSFIIPHSREQFWHSRVPRIMHELEYTW